ncbi:hypothetical protein Pmar_PMAR009498, partial [Perkinsus marinus ATCC 50983]
DEEVSRESSELEQQREGLLRELEEAEQEGRKIKSRLDARIGELIPSTDEDT